MYSEGHQIGSHSWSHVDFTTISSQQRREELLRLESALVDILGFFPVYFRPPFTSYNGIENELRDMGYHNVRPLTLIPIAVILVG
jgi:peptidoglycan/xylan/chitin deacetylase (PgdA/CDA1 family)